ncbi:pyridoxal 5'-phosphate synthase glutaminase subunit PdxT [Ornithinimicrobium pratense]|uniref:Pyridoxal 5'-phosphate synthase subunit PdxT n=1 Tax=Ornithinimicrobium pratense TaxID=2593973 RepID=A0A5J6V8S0_9MICO|nr:pyridoxal 5'-phosphate synthase glutaminase subunit PdxT [Ornithinimicrobium pratense]
MVGVLAVQGDVREHVLALRQLGAEPRTVRRPAELEGLAGLVVPGGESTTIDRLSRVFGLHEPIQELIRDGLPVYGSCAGMIQLAGEVLDGHPEQQSFGGIDMTVRRNAFGRQVDSFEADLPVAGIEGEPFRAVFIRAPWVERLGEQVEVLAEVDGHPVAVRQGALLATSFHPEVTGDHRVHALFLAMCVRAQT